MKSCLNAWARRALPGLMAAAAAVSANAAPVSWVASGQIDATQIGGSASESYAFAFSFDTTATGTQPLANVTDYGLLSASLTFGGKVFALGNETLLEVRNNYFGGDWLWISAKAIGADTLFGRAIGSIQIVVTMIDDQQSMLSSLAPPGDLSFLPGVDRFGTTIGGIATPNFGISNSRPFTLAEPPPPAPAPDSEPPPPSGATVPEPSTLALLAASLAAGALASRPRRTRPA